MAALTLKQESSCPSSPQSLKYLLSVFLVRLFYKPADCSPPGSPVHAILQVKNTGVGCRFLLQGIFATQGSNLHVLHGQFVYHESAGKPEPRLSNNPLQKRWLAPYPKEQAPLSYGPQWELERESK